MQLEALKIFVDVVRHRSFSHGAGENQVTQSSASQAIRHLEDELGVRLIDRTHRPWELTTEGRRFYDGCREVVAGYQRLVAEVKGVQGEADTELRLVGIYSIGLWRMNELLAAFQARHPEARLHVEYRHPDQVYQEVQDGTADVGIVSFPQPRRELTVTPWREEPMVVALPPSHPLAGRERLTPKALAGQKWVAFDRDLVIRRQIDRYLKRHGGELEVVLEFDNIEAIKGAVELGSGLAILPRPALERELKSGSLVAVPLSPAELTRPLGLLQRRGHKPSALAADFVVFLQQRGAQP